MTSSERTKLDLEVLEAVARRVGRCYVGDPGTAVGGRIALVGGKFNGGVTQRLLEGALAALDAHGVASESVSVAWVPGAFEIPLAALRFASSGASAVVALGSVIRGDTPHFDFVAGQCAAGCREVSLSTGVPVIFGVLTTDTVEQALERSEPGKDNRGYDAAVTALEMADLMSRLPNTESPR